VPPLPCPPVRFVQYLSELRCLGLRALGLDDAEVEALADDVLPHLALLEELQLADNQITNEALEVLCEGLLALQPPELRRLDVSHNELNTGCFHTLLAFLREATVCDAQLVEVVLSGNGGPFSAEQTALLLQACPLGCRLALPGASTERAS
jgi:Ran GTPase-activating protein (RanGAP) involved in mRNA processing and transport